MNSAVFPMTMIITAIREEAAAVRSITLAPAVGAAPAYQAGQFLTFSFRTGPKEARRSYSLSSAPGLGEPLTLTVKRVDNGAFSRLLIDRARIGDRLQVTGIAGLFTLPDRLGENPLLFFAAGIGITPVYSLLKELSARGFPAPATLIYSNRSREEAVFARELDALEREAGGRLQIEWIFSDHKDLQRARLSRNLMNELLGTYLHEPGRTLCYLCGPEDYRWLVQLLLEEAGVPADHIRQEIFVAQRSAVVQAPPDKERHEVRLLIRGRSYLLPVQYPDTVLAAARKAGVELPYSCAAGRCSSCVALCTKGRIWMSYNEVLTAHDLERGLVLTCTGYPVGGDAVLELPD